jgi:hypothetical protein
MNKRSRGQQALLGETPTFIDHLSFALALRKFPQLPKFDTCMTSEFAGIEAR